MARIMIANIEEQDGETVTVQVNGKVEDELLPGEAITVNVDADSPCVISVED